ncbi:hypothetical protein BGZ72_009405 [Mortierella alpina]|nr:hypothetical protein BGZ72_009405 [Mortierella alpina]
MLVSSCFQAVLHIARPVAAQDSGDEGDNVESAFSEDSDEYEYDREDSPSELPIPHLSSAPTTSSTSILPSLQPSDKVSQEHYQAA